MPRLSNITEEEKVFCADYVVFFNWVQTIETASSTEMTFIEQYTDQRESSKIPRMV